MGQSYETDVAISGGGPAGMVMALLLAKQGIRTMVLERHSDFEREYRGEVLMLRFVQMMRQINLYDFLEKYPHLKLSGFELFLNIAEMAKETPYILWMPQPVMLAPFKTKAGNSKTLKSVLMPAWTDC